MRIETKVGIFVVAALLMLFGLTTQVGSFKFGQKSGYPIVVHLDNANGLEKNANVKSRGINIGYIQGFQLNNAGVDVDVVVYNDYKIPQDSVASIKQEGMLGVKYIDILFSDSKSFLSQNESLTKNKSYATFDDMSDSINDATNNLSSFIKRLDDLIAKNEKNFTELITNFRDVGAEFKQTGITINDKLPKIMDKFENIEDGIQGILDENRATLKSAIANVDTAFEDVSSAAKTVKTAYSGVTEAAKSVEKAFDKVDDYLTSTTKSTLGVEMRVEDLIDDENTKTYFGIDYSPKPTVHYLVDVVSSNDYRDDGTGLPKNTTIHEKGRTLISAQYGKDYNNLRLRGGIIESTGGIGVDYFSDSRKWKYTLEAFDFNAYNDVRGDKTHLKTYLQYTMKKHILLYTGVDNFLNTDARKYLFGIGVRFEDNDLKYLLGSAASSF